MVRQSWLAGALCVVMCLSVVAVAGGAEIYMGAVLRDGLYRAEIFLELDEAATVHLSHPQVVHITEPSGPQQEAEWATPWFADLADLNERLEGDFTLTIGSVDTGGGLYRFAVAPILASTFVPMPQLDPVPAQIAQQHTFRWTWQGQADVRVAEYWGDDHPQFEHMAFFDAADDGFADLSCDADFQTYLGAGQFMISYGIWTPDGVSNWRLLDGTDLFLDGPMAFHLSESIANFQVVPEPATLSLLALAGGALLRRRRR